MLIAGGRLTGTDSGNYTWTGLGANRYFSNVANWLSLTVPTSGASLIFGPASTGKVVLTDNASVTDITFSYEASRPGSASFVLGATTPVTLTLGGNILVSDPSFGAETTVFGSSITLSLTSGLHSLMTSSSLDVYAADIGSYGETLSKKHFALAISGNVTGTGGFTLSGGTNQEVALLGSGNDFSGGVVLDGGAVAIASGTGLGSGTLTVTGNGGVLDLVNTGSITVANTLLLGGNLTLSSWSGTGNTTFTGALSLTAASTIAYGGSMSLFLTGSMSGSYSLTFDKTGCCYVYSAPIVLTGNNSAFTGDTYVYNGTRLIFGSSSSLGTGNIIADSSSYVGYAGGTGVQNSFLSHLSSDFAGYIGFDTLTANSTPLVVGANETLDLSALTSYRGIGSSTYAQLASTANIVLPSGQPYKFGGGGGTLYVSTGLTGNDTTDGYRVYATDSSTETTTIILAGYNTFTGNINVDGSALVLAGPNALPTGSMIGFGTSGYAGFTQNFLTSSNTTATFADFISLIIPSTVSSSGIPSQVVGIDSADVLSPRTITDQTIDLTAGGAIKGVLGFGTSSNIVIGSNVSFTLADAAAGTLYLNAVKSGYLQFDTAFTTTANSTSISSVYIGGGSLQQYGTVDLRAANTYTGGTTLASGTLALGNASALGTGTLDVTGISTLVASVAGLTGQNSIANPITLTANLTLGQTSNANAFTLSGNISGTGSLLKIGSADIVLGGDNSYSGLTVSAGLLTLASNTAAGAGLVQIGSNGSLGFTATANNPVLHGLDGSGTVQLANVTELIIDYSGQASPSDPVTPEYAGSIVGTTASLYKTGSGTQVLGGNNTYAGGTTVGAGILVASSSSALGTGNVTVANSAGLGVNAGVTLTNALTLMDGARLGGYGTFAPTTTSTSGSLVFSNTTTVSPGSPQDGDRRIGNLTLAAPVTFGGGGIYVFDLQNASGTSGQGYDLLTISSVLTISATAASSFTLFLQSIDTSGTLLGEASFDSSQSYQWVIATATGISFTDNSTATTAFTVDTTNFTNSLGTGSFYVTATSTELLLNFTPVPEPSTYALLLVGLGAMSFPALRRRWRR